MSDHPEPKRSLSEISHLFLSNIRDRQTGGAPRPVRKPPARPAVSIDLTPEEFAKTFSDLETAPLPPAQPKFAPIIALLSTHLNGKQCDYARRYARHLAAQVGRVGLIELDSAECRISCFDRSKDAGETAPVQSTDARHLSEAIEELNCDIDAWLLLMPNPRVPEARGLLRDAHRWTLLTTCDHDGIVSCYRTLKGLADLNRPVLSLALFDAKCDDEAERVSRKLAMVCQQFLHWKLDGKTIVHAADEVAEHLVLCCRPPHDKNSHGPQWEIISNFLSRAVPSNAEVPKLTHIDTAERELISDMHEPELKSVLADVVVPPAAAAPASPAPSPVQSAPVQSMPMPARAPSAKSNEEEVIDMAAGDSSEAILTSVIRHAAGELIDTPVHPPMCPSARLVVNRERGLVLLAAASHGLTDLRAIGQAYRWLIENRPLIGMAIPQFAIDAHRMPSLRLFVDHADLSADVLQPMFQSSNVTVQAYRKLRWGNKTGLLLEAA